MKNEYEIVAYIKEHPVAVLSTSGKHHTPHGAAVYLCATSAKQLYFVTKTETRKFQNIHDYSEVAVTIVDPTNNSSLQAHGNAKAVNDASTIELILSKMAKIYAHGSDWLPPITKIRAGAYQVVSIEVEDARLSHYKDFHPGDKRIFKEL